LGVYREDLVEKLAHVLKNLGCRHGFVVHGMDGMDEITLTTETRLAEVTPGGVTVKTLVPEDLGLPRCRMEDLRGGDAVGNAAIVRAILAGKKGPTRDIVLLNAAFALVAAGKAADPQEGCAKAAEAIDTGRAMQQLEKLIAMTND
ncbi:MAG TPA: anthranilate phosphoribosyltransferase, partial [Geobacteraceae bacterium]|nr:anthranilate phosphoribosyltransferase [Geobacteraceae bacterium]